MQCAICQSENEPTAVSCKKCSTPLPWNNPSLGATISGGTLPPEAIPSPGPAWSIAVTSPSVARGAEGELLVGTLVAERYEILELLGQGGMGAVYKARDTELERLVALKLIRPELASNPEILRRFKQELILAREVTHRNVIRIFDLGQAIGIKFITMEFVEGRDLRTVLRERGKLPPGESVQIMAQICRALEAAHVAGVVHRDLKPQNIMLDAKDRVYVMDFGIAHSLETPGMTQTGALMGTPEYMSPEQAKGMKVDARSDLFALGIIFYEMLTGVSPYKADTAIATLLKRTQERPQPLADLDPTIPKVISDVVVKCLEINRDHRYSTAREILEDLGHEMPTGIRTIAPTILPAAVAPKPAKVSLFQQHRIWIAGIAASLLLALIGVASYAIRGRIFRARAAPHSPITVLVADFSNQTGDPIFDGTLEPMFNVALEGASFVNAFNRSNARKLAQELPHPSDKLDEQSARLVAVGQSMSAVVIGELNRRGEKYDISATALDAVSGNVIAKTEVTAGNKDEVLLAIPRLAAPIRQALGDTTPESVQLEAARGPFTAASLEAVHQYGLAMDQQFAGKLDEALQSFSKAVELDPNFGRAYAGMAAVYGILGQRQDSEKYIKLAMEHVDRMTERERYRIRGQYYFRTGNWQNCVGEYGEYLKQYPADNVGQDLLAICFERLHNMPKAMEEANRALQIAPKDLFARMNVALFACYSGDFQSCEREGREAQKLNPLLEEGYLVLAYAQLGQDQLPQAAEVYQKLQKVSERGASLAAFGLANLALYEGRYRQALQILEKSTAADVAAKKPDRAAEDFAMLAYTEFLRGDKQAALADSEKALANSQSVKFKFLAARTFVEAGETAKARKLAATLGSELQAEPQAYAKLIEGEAALKEHDPQRALQLLTEAKNLIDSWIVHLDLGLVYLEAGAFAEADSEFDRCLKRRGEALEFFDDDMPTYSYLPAVYYYQGRVREGLKSPGFADSYRTYLGIRGKAGEDPLLADIRHRLG